jgi:phospholipase/lecithinase/hemolysin
MGDNYTKPELMKQRILTIGFVILSFLLPLRATAANFSQIYVFGDSLSDIGNSFNTKRVPPSPPYYQGRSSNGPVWVEYLATNLELAPNQQINYAFSGATTGSNNTLIPGEQGLRGLQQQIDGFKKSNPSADPKALYIVWVGANDYLGGGVTNPTIPIKNLLTAVNSLAESGAKNIMVVNLPSLGELPLARNNIQASSRLNTLTSLHNSGLSASLNFLSQQTHAKIILLDVNSLFHQAIAAPTAFGFTNVTDSCLAVGCTNPNEYLFWDNLHPTTAAHAKLGELAFSALESKPVPQPSANLGVLAMAALGAVALHQ